MLKEWIEGDVKIKEGIWGQWTISAPHVKTISISENIPWFNLRLRRAIKRAQRKESLYRSVVNPKVVSRFG